MDGDGVIRIVGFEKAQQKKLEEPNKIPVSLTNCQIKNNKTNNKLEAVLRSYTKIEESNVKFKMAGLRLQDTWK